MSIYELQNKIKRIDTNVLDQIYIIHQKHGTTIQVFTKTSIVTSSFVVMMIKKYTAYQ